MSEFLRYLLNKGTKASVVKKFVNNPEKFVLKGEAEVINDEIVISIRVKEKAVDPEE